MTAEHDKAIPVAFGTLPAIWQWPFRSDEWYENAMFQWAAVAFCILHEMSEPLAWHGTKTQPDGYGEVHKLCGEASSRTLPMMSNLLALIPTSSKEGKAWMQSFKTFLIHHHALVHSRARFVSLAGAIEIFFEFKVVHDEFCEIERTVLSLGTPLSASNQLIHIDQNLLVAWFLLPWFLFNKFVLSHFVCIFESSVNKLIDRWDAWGSKIGQYLWPQGEWDWNWITANAHCLAGSERIQRILLGKEREWNASAKRREELLGEILGRSLALVVLELCE